MAEIGVVTATEIGCVSTLIEFLDQKPSRSLARSSTIPKC